MKTSSATRSQEAWLTQVVAKLQEARVVTAPETARQVAERLYSEFITPSGALSLFLAERNPRDPSRG